MDDEGMKHVKPIILYSMNVYIIYLKIDSNLVAWIWVKP